MNAWPRLFDFSPPPPSTFGSMLCEGTPLCRVQQPLVQAVNMEDRLLGISTPNDGRHDATPVSAVYAHWIRPFSGTEHVRLELQRRYGTRTLATPFRRSSMVLFDGRRIPQLRYAQHWSPLKSLAFGHVGAEWSHAFRNNCHRHVSGIVGSRLLFMRKSSRCPKT